MQVIIVAFATLVLGVGLLANDHTQTSEDLVSPPKKQQLLEEQKTVLGTEVPKAQEASAGDLTGYVYPNAQTLSSSAEKLELKSTDNPDIITQWYKDKLKQNDFSINTSVKTTTNGVVSNKLSASNGQTTYEVSISKDNGPEVLITVRRS